MADLSAAVGGLAWSWAGSSLGAFAAWLPARPAPAVQSSLLGFAAGVMIAATLLGLIPDALEAAGPGGLPLVLIGLVAGLAAIALLDRLLPHQHPGAPAPDHRRGMAPSMAMLIALALTIHNIPEGMAVGVTAAAGEQLPSGTAVIAALATHNVVEGLLVALPLRLAGMGVWPAFWLGQLAGAVEVAAGVLAALWLPFGSAMIPALLAAAGGAMLFVAIEELLPEAIRCNAGNTGPLGAVVGVIGIIVLTGLLA